MQQTAANAPEEWETLVALGALAWRPEGHDPILRHVPTQPVRIEFDRTPRG